MKGRTTRDRRNDKEEDGQTTKKRTGCAVKDSYTRHEDGKPVHVDHTVVTGWNYSARYGLVKFIAVPSKNRDGHYANKSGVSGEAGSWDTMIVKVKHPGPVLPFKTTGFWDGKSLHMPDLDMIARPGSGDGGYWGRNFKTKS
jgi:hypothetical protein